MKKLIAIFLIASALLPLSAKNVVIMHTNDMKNALAARDAVFINPDFPPRLGGILSLSTAVKYERAKAEKNSDIFLLFDSGNFCFKSADGESVDLSYPAVYMNHMKYDAVNLGVDEISGGVKFLRSSYKEFSMPLLLTNVSPVEGPRFIDRYAILDREGIRIGVFGLTSEYALFHLSDRVLGELAVGKEIENAREIVSILKANRCDMIIGITSIGYEHDLLLADSVSGIDIILSGGEGRGMREPVETSLNHTIVFRGYGELSSVERIILKVDEMGSILGYEGNSITLFEEAYPPDTELEKKLNRIIVQED